MDYTQLPGNLPVLTDIVRMDYTDMAARRPAIIEHGWSVAEPDSQGYDPYNNTPPAERKEGDTARLGALRLLPE